MNLLNFIKDYPDEESCKLKYKELMIFAIELYLDHLILQSSNQNYQSCFHYYDDQIHLHYWNWNIQPQ